MDMFVKSIIVVMHYQERRRACRKVTRDYRKFEFHENAVS